MIDYITCTVKVNSIPQKDLNFIPLSVVSIAIFSITLYNNFQAA
jgi:hypothetical protein